jgi:hypothetical protein
MGSLSELRAIAASPNRQAVTRTSLKNRENAIQRNRAERFASKDDGDFDRLNGFLRYPLAPEQVYLLLHCIPKSQLQNLRFVLTETFSPSTIVLCRF